jgi:hypothetical protein
MRTDIFFRGLSIAGSVVLVILLGMCWGMTNIPPADFVRRGVLGIMRMGAEEAGSPEDPNVLEWPEKRVGWQAGVSVHDPEATHGAYTLYTHVREEEALLIDMDGNIRHRWHLPLSKVWDEAAAFGELQEGQLPAWSKARLMSNGDLYVVCNAQPVWPYGRGLVKLDKDSRVIWKNLDFIHHSFDFDANGNVYALAQRMEEEVTPTGELRLPFLNDYLLLIDAAGRTRRRIDLAEAIALSPYSGLYRIAILRQDLGGDYFHSNDVEYVTESMARVHPYARAGDVLVSVRNLNALVVLDVDSGTIRHVIHGPWGWPHDPDLLDNGNILIFDNMGHIGEAIPYSISIPTFRVLSSDWTTGTP